jgi:hypothetical protein
MEFAPWRGFDETRVGSDDSSEVGIAWGGMASFGDD